MRVISKIETCVSAGALMMIVNVVKCVLMMIRKDTKRGQRWPSVTLEGCHQLLLAHRYLCVRSDGTCNGSQLSLARLPWDGGRFCACVCVMRHWHASGRRPLPPQVTPLTSHLFPVGGRGGKEKGSAMENGVTGKYAGMHSLPKNTAVKQAEECDA